jgi:hypothetical protein
MWNLWTPLARSYTRALRSMSHCSNAIAIDVFLYSNDDHKQLVTTPHIAIQVYKNRCWFNILLSSPKDTRTVESASTKSCDLLSWIPYSSIMLPPEKECALAQPGELSRQAIYYYAYMLQLQIVCLSHVPTLGSDDPNAHTIWDVSGEWWNHMVE